MKAITKHVAGLLGSQQTSDNHKQACNFQNFTGFVLSCNNVYPVCDNTTTVL